MLIFSFLLLLLLFEEKKTSLEEAYSKSVTCVHPRSFVDASCTCPEGFPVAVAALGSGWTLDRADMWAVCSTVVSC